MKPVYSSSRLVLTVVSAVVLILFAFESFGQDYDHLKSIGASGPMGVATDASDNLYIVERQNHRVRVLDPQGNLIRDIGSYGEGDGQIELPAAIALDASGNVYVGDDNGVQVFTSTGEFLRRLHTNHVNGLALDAAGNIYITQAFSIHVYNNNLTTRLRSFGEYGSGPGQFDNCNGVKVDDKLGRLYVSEMFNHRVQVFTLDGTYIAQFGSKGSGDGQFQHPGSIAIDGSGYIYVTDEGNNRVQVFSWYCCDSYTMVRKFGSAGINTYQFRSPADIAFNRAGDIYIADYWNERVQVFSKTPDAVHGFENITKTFGDPDFELSATSGSERYPRFMVVEDPANTGEVEIGDGGVVTIVKAGTVKLRAYVPDDVTYGYAYVEATLTINKAAQSITFDPLGPKIVGEESFTLSANATSLLDVTFTSSNPEVAIVEGNVITLKSAGTTVITAHQEGDENYEPATSVEHELVGNAITDVAPGMETITEVFPVPARDMLQIRSRFITPATKVKVLDSFGHIVGELSAAATAENTLQVSIGHLPPGMYYLQLNVPQISTQRIVKN